MNKEIIKKFEELIYQLYLEEDDNNIYRIKALENSLKIIKKYNKDLNNKDNLEEFKKIKGIGEGTIRRIKEINKTKNLKEIYLTKTNIKYFNDLQKIYGIGNKTASKLIKDKIYTINDLKKAIKQNKFKSNHIIDLGIKYYKLFKENIPRKEMDKHNKFINKVIDFIKNNYDENVKYLMCGSYRREKDYSNDIDIVITYKNKDTPDKIIDTLKKTKYIIDEINYNHKNKFMGFVEGYNNTIRRLDIQFVKSSSYYTAILYFTGSKEFNIKLRNYCIKKGFKLNEYGLYKNNKKIKINNEEDIFKELNLKYIPPNKRN